MKAEPGTGYHGTSGTGSSSASGGDGGGALESIAGSMFGGALGLIPLVGSLFGLFGGKSSTQPVFEKYEMPSSISFEAADTGNGNLTSADYDQMGLPRLFSGSESAPASSPNVANSSAAPSGGAGAASVSSGPNGSPNISVNVQAMDAQSFMSYSGEIAKAVRDAMLNLSSVNDVVSEL